MKLSDYLSEKQIIVGAKSKKKKESLKELLGALVSLRKISPRSRNKILSSLMARERLGSTAIGQGVAIPHARLELVKKSLVVIGLFEEGLEFDSLDGELVYVVFLILSPKELEGFHLKMLATISKLLRDKYFLERLKKSKTASEISQLIKSQEERM
ncbi:MAG: PTS sugar transporter subunit IIA [Candidatus Omnitrophica bacterium]|nr:PTS sugar transporter subunit IIA [Candidatus Omnitrophota bacterium]